MRKRHLEISVLLPSPRFTRTHAEKTKRTRRRCCLWSIYPHTCGKDSRTLMAWTSPPDLPAHMRKRPDPTTVGPAAFRFTRTHAEKTRRAAGSRRMTTIYPHTCGKDYYGQSNGWIAIDLPAHMRKRRPQPHVEQGQQRFTRTHAEKTVITDLKTSKCSIYPHTCGKDFHSIVSAISRFDLPAHMRKRLQEVATHCGANRFTRTHAEKTCRGRRGCLP